MGVVAREIQFLIGGGQSLVVGGVVGLGVRWVLRPFQVVVLSVHGGLRAGAVRLRAVVVVLGPVVVVVVVVAVVFRVPVVVVVVVMDVMVVVVVMAVGALVGMVVLVVGVLYWWCCGYAPRIPWCSGGKRAWGFSLWCIVGAVLTPGFTETVVEGSKLLGSVGRRWW